jgi:hypothetical protein
VARALLPVNAHARLRPRWTKQADRAALFSDRRPPFHPAHDPPHTSALSFRSRAREASHNTPSSLSHMPLLIAPLLTVPPRFDTRSAAPTPPTVATQVRPSQVLPKLFPNPMWGSLSSCAAVRSRTEESLSF